MSKVLVIDVEKCTGCRLCEAVCSTVNEGVSNPARSRVKVVRFEWDGLQVPTVCQQCEDAACVAVCPVKALTRDEALGCVRVNYELCIGCRVCMMACPFGAMSFDPVNNRVIKCELCDGDPACVRFCEPGAIQYVDTSMADMAKRRQLGASIFRAIGKAEEEFLGVR